MGSSHVQSGIFAGIGIIYGHELAHTKGFSFVIARWMMALSGKAHFCYAHVYNHHLELGHQDDPATAPRGRSMYTHYPLSGFGQSKFLFMMEKQRLERIGVPFPILAKPLDPRLLHGPAYRFTILVRRRLDRHALFSRRMAYLQL